MAKRTTAIVNHKGGVGKTAISTNLAFTLAMQGNKVLLIDLDPQQHSCITFCLEIDEENTVTQVIKDRGYDINKAIQAGIVNGEVMGNLFIIPSDLSLSLAEVEIYGRTRFEKLLHRQLLKIASNYDYILIDCPPNLGPLTQNAIFSADHILIPVDYDSFSLRGVKTLIDKINEIKEDQEGHKFHVLRNIRDLRDKKVTSKVESEINNNFPDECVIETVIRKATVLKHAREELEPVAVYSPKSLINDDFDKLAEEYILDSNNSACVANREEVVHA